MEAKEKYFHWNPEVLTSGKMPDPLSDELAKIGRRKSRHKARRSSHVSNLPSRFTPDELQKKIVVAADRLLDLLKSPNLIIHTPTVREGTPRTQPAPVQSDRSRSPDRTFELLIFCERYENSREQWRLGVLVFPRAVRGISGDKPGPIVKRGDKIRNPTWLGQTISVGETEDLTMTGSNSICESILLIRHIRIRGENVNSMNIAVDGLELVDDSWSFICRSIVDNDYLEARILLAGEAIQEIGQIGLFIACSNND